MAIDDIIQDPTLRPLLATSEATLEQTLAVIDWLSSHTTTTTTHQSKLELAQQQKVLNACLAKLRQQSRRAAYGARATKQETAEARQEVDRLLLQLQNLFYEQRHLTGEIDACEGYDHAYTHLPLLTLEEYLAMFPDQSGLSEEELMPKRIEYEKEERERMEQERQELLKTKDALLKENAKKKDELKKMDEKLESMIDGMTPLEDALKNEL